MHVVGMYCHLVRLATSKTKSGGKRQNIYFGGYPNQFIIRSKILGHSREIFTISTDFLIVPPLKTLQLYIAIVTVSTLQYIGAFEKLSRVYLYQQPHFYS